MEKEVEGFVTLEHNLDLLKEMNDPFPHTVALVDGRLVGYALTMLKEMKSSIEGLEDMFAQLSRIDYGGRAFMQYRFFIMGQICVDKAFRKKGVFRGLYDTIKTNMKAHFDFLITEIARENLRSINAHKAVGFETLKVHRASDGKDWAIVLLRL